MSVMDYLLSKEEISQLSILEKKVKAELKDSRYRHTVSVAHCAAALSMVHGAPLFKALAAGLLHDCAKCYTDDELLSKCRKKGLPVREIEEVNPSLLHSKYGAYLAKEKYGITDDEILSAIECHTTGKPAMSLLDKIIFTADYIEPYRNHTDMLVMIRRVAFQDLDRAVLMILKGTLQHLEEQGVPVDEMTRMTCDYYNELQK